MISAMPSNSAFVESVRRLHHLKDAAYQDAWKKRGEVMSIMANIARKVDRLEYVTAGGPTTPDESLIDTAIDLLVYSLKYQTYLADQDGDVATRLFSGGDVTIPYSDGPGGFNALLDALDLTPFGLIGGPDLPQATSAVLDAFGDLEACFHGGSVPVGRRLECARALTGAAVILVSVLRREAPERYRDFLAMYLKETC